MNGDDLPMSNTKEKKSTEEETSSEEEDEEQVKESSYGACSKKNRSEDESSSEEKGVKKVNKKKKLIESSDDEDSTLAEQVKKISANKKLLALAKNNSKKRKYESDDESVVEENLKKKKKDLPELNNKSSKKERKKDSNVVSNSKFTDRFVHVNLYNEAPDNVVPKTIMLNNSLLLSCQLQCADPGRNLNFDYAGLTITRKIKDDKCFDFNMPLNVAPTLIKALNLIIKENKRFFSRLPNASSPSISENSKYVLPDKGEDSD